MSSGGRARGRWRSGQTSTSVSIVRLRPLPTRFHLLHETPVAELRIFLHDSVQLFVAHHTQQAPLPPQSLHIHIHVPIPRSLSLVNMPTLPAKVQFTILGFCGCVFADHTLVSRHFLRFSFLLARHVLDAGAALFDIIVGDGCFIFLTLRTKRPFAVVEVSGPAGRTCATRGRDIVVRVSVAVASGIVDPWGSPWATCALVVRWWSRVRRLLIVLIAVVETL